MMTKSQVLNSVGSLPEQFSIDELIDRLLFVDKIETGLTQSKTGRVNSEEEAKQKLSKWLK